MVEKVIVNTTGEEKALIPDRWVLGRGLSTDEVYITHTSFPLMIVKYPADAGNGSRQPCMIYLNGDIDPDRLNRLFAEAWQLLEIYRHRAGGGTV